MTNWRTLCEELLDELLARPLILDRALIARARAALAQPEPEVVGLSDEELLALMPKDMRDEFSYAAKVCSDATGGQVKPGIFRVCLNRTALDFARAALARYDRPAPAAEGEVAELVAWLRNMANADLGGIDELNADRAADLLEQRHPAPVPEEAANPWKDALIDALVCNFLLNKENESDPKKALHDLVSWETRLAGDPSINPLMRPVSVSERLPGPEDCDGEGRCWWFLPAQQLEILRQSDAWSFRKHSPRKDDYCRWTHWLSSTALLLPAGEVE